ncbi:hypothetical protein [Elizabethkingia miricola]|uniref:hypothetical protein n=1 Tax=Elizabethkingia miricola TaxID=172045 RepID=UPI0012D880DD|nr:hypothetical protein [Elizabethkingia miricola]MCT3927006.1 hypothetical protein [Elizabethkingia anophelis]MCT4101608.1 hypothetical protein [Elizabethkingia anophelis]MCT4166130.1 hypothetical protein [Elizabethkingia anophelis]HAY3541109.1 hypothetical protein [Elizabethkingia anophelis]
MNKKLTLFCCLLAIVLPVMGFAQTDSDYSNLLQFLKGDSHLPQMPEESPLFGLY